MSNAYKFPVFHQSYAASLTDQPVLLNGQRVRFDKKVQLVPANLHTNAQPA